MIDKQILNEAAQVAFQWNTYRKFREDAEKIKQRLAVNSWFRFRRSGIDFVHKHGTETSRRYLGIFLRGATRRMKGPVHFLLNDV